MHLNDVLKKCKEKGYPISATALYMAGKKNGFLSSNEGCRNLRFDKDKFLNWLQGALEEVPEGWITVNELHKKFGITLYKAYVLANDKDSGMKRIGSGVGVMYVDPRRIEAVIERRRKERMEDWGEE